MTQPQGDSDSPSTRSFLRFVSERLSPLSQAFAKSRLRQLRLSDAGGSITLVKSAASQSLSAAQPRSRGESAEAKPSHVARLSGGEPGQSYETVNAEVVGTFHPADDVPQPGERMEARRALGYVEALRLRTPVRVADEAVLVAQVAEDGQAVEFGETLFIVERSAAAGGEAPPATAVSEPPRI